MDKRYDISNPLVSKEDIADHNGVAAVIHHPSNPNKILMLNHVKYSFWTIPVGKCSFEENVCDGVCKEVFEETNISILKMNKLGSFIKVYERGPSVKTKIESFLFDVVEFSGLENNMEPEKHSDMKWIDISDLKMISPYNLSDITRFYLFLDDLK